MWIAALIAGIASIAGLLIQKSQNKKAADYNFELGEQSAENAYQRQMNAWEQQNAYNTPSEQLKRINMAGLSPGLMYSGGTAAGSNAGMLPSVAQGGNTGTFEAPRINDHMQSAINALSLRKQESEIQVNESIAEKNRSESGVINPARERLMNSQMALNSILGENWKARTSGQLLTNALQQDLNPLTIEQARQTVQQNRVKLEQFVTDLERSKVDLSFSRETFSDRARIIQADLQNKMLGLAIQKAQELSIQAGTRLTAAQAREAEAVAEQYINSGWHPKSDWKTNLGNVAYRFSFDYAHKFIDGLFNEIEVGFKNSWTKPTIYGRPSSYDFKDGSRFFGGHSLP